MYLFFDTETTGLPKDWNAPATNTRNWPRLVQIAWLLIDKQENQVASKNFIIKPDGFIIPPAATQIHGITMEKATSEGSQLSGVLTEFAEDINRSDILVAHNISYDENVVAAEFIRKNIQSNLFQKRRLCTMKSSTEFCRIPGNYGLKWPTLTELHYSLFQKNFNETHHADIDVGVCAKCFFKLKKLGIITA